MSHELRTPLNAIIGFSELLSNDALAALEPRQRQEYAELIHSSGLHLLSVVNGILDMSKIESGHFPITAEPFALPALVKDCMDLFHLKAADSGIGLSADLPDILPELVADKRACKQILLNLLSNALKFTLEGGRVTVSARCNNGEMIIEVSDTGIGIAPEDMSRLGDPFFQARSSYDRPYEGTGLGLSVVKGLVGLHGGHFEITSRLAVGTRVRVRLPLDASVGSVAGGVIAALPRRRHEPEHMMEEVKLRA